MYLNVGLLKDLSFKTVSVGFDKFMFHERCGQVHWCPNLKEKDHLDDLGADV
jgi:hypothetical protein